MIAESADATYAPYVAEPGRTRLTRRPLTGDWCRLALAVAWLAFLVTTATLGSRESSLAHLERAIASGDVTEVQVVGGLPSGARGTATAELRWRAGLFDRTATVTEARPRDEATSYDDPVVAGDVADRLRSFDDRGDLRVVDLGDRFESSSSTFAGFAVPRPLGLVGLGLFVATVLLVVGGPEPWRVNRWGWFWLVALAPVVGVAMFLLLSGPTPLLRGPWRDARRLTGGWAFILGVVLP